MCHIHFARRSVPHELQGEQKSGARDKSLELSKAPRGTSTRNTATATKRDCAWRIVRTMCLTYITPGSQPCLLLIHTFARHMVVASISPPANRGSMQVTEETHSSPLRPIDCVVRHSPTQTITRGVVFNSTSHHFTLSDELVQHLSRFYKRLSNGAALVCRSAKPRNKIGKRRFRALMSTTRGRGLPR